MPALILPPRNTPDARAIAAAAQQEGWQIEQLPNWRAPERLRGRDLVLYGEPLFADVVTPALGLTLLEPTMDWTAGLPYAYRRREIRFTTLGAAKGHPEPAFIKPAEDKCFPAAVYGRGAALPHTVHSLPDATPVLLAEAVHWEIEFRCFVLERTVATLSPYWRDGELAQAEDGSWPASPRELEEALAYAGTLLGDAAVGLPAAVVVDIGRIADRGWAVVEANAAWGSGIYGCQPARILPVLRRAALPLDGVGPADRPWVRRQYVIG